MASDGCRGKGKTSSWSPRACALQPVLVMGNHPKTGYPAGSDGSLLRAQDDSKRYGPITDDLPRWQQPRVAPTLAKRLRISRRVSAWLIGDGRPPSPLQGVRGSNWPPGLRCAGAPDRPPGAMRAPVHLLRRARRRCRVWEGIRLRVVAFGSASAFAFFGWLRRKVGLPPET